MSSVNDTNNNKLYNNSAQNGANNSTTNITKSRSNRAQYFRNFIKRDNAKARMDRTLIARLNSHYHIFDTNDLDNFMTDLAGRGGSIKKEISKQHEKNNNDISALIKSLEPSRK